MNRFFLTIITLFFAVTHYAQNGIIKGRVLDATTNEPISFANVYLTDTRTVGTTTDLEGYYLLESLTPGLYNVSVSSLGYATETQYEIQVSNARPSEVNFTLGIESETSPEVEVTAPSFAKTDQSPVSLRSIGTAEIQRNPGGNRDISRVVRVLPGVLTSPSFRNDLLIRGGAPNENRFYLDDVEIPTINHFATQGASGGPNGLINVDFIRNVDFFSGAFPANRGNALSSVFNFQQRDGRDDRLGATATLGTSDLALTLEGPVSKKTSFLFSVRQSYLQFLFDAIGLPFLPTYNDFQFKVKTEIDNNSEFYVTGIGAIDRFKLNLDANETPEQRYFLNNLPINNQWNYTLGAVYKRYNNNGFWTFVLSRSMLNNDILKYEDNDESKPKTIDYNAQEIGNKARIERTVQTDFVKLRYGIAYEYTRYTNRTLDFRVRNSTVESYQLESELDFHQFGGFIQASKKLFDDKLALSAGLRSDANSYSKSMSNPLQQLSPRLSLSYNFTPRFALNFNSGIYYQLPPYPTLGYRENNILVNKENNLKYIQSTHFVAGLEYTTSTNTKFSIEGYYKKYKNYPFLLNRQIALANLGADFEVLGNAPVSSSAEGRTMGLEFLIQQRLFKGFYGLFSYTLGLSEFEDRTGELIPSAWDSRHIFNLAVGKNIPTMNQAIFDEKNAKRIAKGRKIKQKMIPQTLELGVNMRYQSGLPYTPFDEAASARVENWDRLGRGIRDYSQLNSLRAGAFYALDFRIDYKWFFPKWNFNLYLDLQNIPSVAAGAPFLLLDQGESGEEPVQVVNPGQPNASYVLRKIQDDGSPVLPTLGVIVQF